MPARPKRRRLHPARTAAGLDREFRGHASQPLALGLFGEIGTLDPILDQDHERIPAIEPVAFGPRYRVIDFADLPSPYESVLLMGQRPPLSSLIGPPTTGRHNHERD